MQTVNFKTELAKDIVGAFNVHTRWQDLPLEVIQQIQVADSNPFAVGCINLTGNVNIGTIIRTAVLHGAQKVIIFGRKTFDARSCVGSDKYIDIEYVECLDRVTLEIDNDVVVNTIRSQSYVPVIVEQGGISLQHIDWNHEIAGTTPILMLGNENRGVDLSLQNRLENEVGGFVVSIPQKGVLRSHNVAVAAGIVMSNMCMSMGWF